MSAAQFYDPARPLPSAADMEKCLLSCVMQATDFAMASVSSRIRPEHFAIEAHATVYEVMLEQANLGKPVDLPNLLRVLLDRGLAEKIGGPAALSEMATAAPDPAKVQHYAIQVHDKWRLRQGALLCSSALNKFLVCPNSEEIRGIIGELEDGLMRLTGETLHTHTGIRSGEEVALRCADTFLTRHANKGKILGLQLGVPDLDRRVNGFQRGDFIVMGARPAMGKTSCATCFAESVALDVVNGGNVPVLMFTLEMSDEQIMERSLLGRAHVGLTKGRTGMFSDAEASVLYAARKSLATTRGQSVEARAEHLRYAAFDGLEAYLTRKGKLAKLKTKGELQDYLEEAQRHLRDFSYAFAATAAGLISFYDGYGVTIQEIRSQIRTWVRRIGWNRESPEIVPPLVIIDYLQLVKASKKSNMGDPRLTSIEVCEALKGTAKELGIVIMGLAQVKVNDKRPEAEPQMSDIKESGAYAEYPDYVFTLHRPAYYRKWPGLTEEQRDWWNEKADEASRARDASLLLPDEEWGGEAYYKRHAKLGIRKARHAPTDDINLIFNGHEVRFAPITDDLYSTNQAKREQPTTN
jgi:replicative DNA helicase